MPLDFDPHTPTENHIGEVGGNIGAGVSQFGPSASTTYAAGQVLLAATQLAGTAHKPNGTGFIFGATLALNVANAVQVDLFVFTSQPVGSYAAGSAFSLTAADQAKVPKVLHVDDWTAAGSTAAVGQCSDKGPRLFQCADATNPQSLWIVAVARGSITLASATDGTLALHTKRN